MSWKNNKDTIVTNIVQQSCAIVVFLMVPNILGVADYGKVVFVGTLISFSTFSDLGLSFVYGRKMPAIYASGNQDEIQMWNETLLTFRLYTGVAFGVLIGLVYFMKYHNGVDSMLLSLLPILSVVVSFYISRETAQEKFSTYRKINVFQSITRLSIVPGVLLLGLSGWFSSQVLAILLTLYRLPKQFFRGIILNINPIIIKTNIVEGMVLGAITTLWLQLLSSGRIFASFMYPDTVVAQYGLINTGYQIVASLIISAFLPQTVKVYKMMENSPKDAIAYTFKTILYAIPIVFIMTVISRELSPFVLEYFFPKYKIDYTILNALIFSLPVYPLLVTLGSVLVASKKSRAYLGIITLSVIFNFLILYFLTSYYGYASAAIAQIVTLFIYSGLLLGLIYFLFWDDIKHKLSNILAIYGSIFCLFFVYLFVKEAL